MMCMKQSEYPDLSVITVCYNAREVLPRCVESVRHLRDENRLSYEHVIIDGASTDGTAEYVAQLHAEGKVAQYVSEPDAGIYDAMNKGIRMAKGKIIILINADDELVADGCYACCEPILAGRCLYTVGQSQIVDTKGVCTGLTSVDFENVFIRSPYSHQALFCSTALYREHGGYMVDKRFRIVADSVWKAQMAAMKIPYEVVPVVCSRFHLGGVSCSAETHKECIRLILLNEPYLAEQLPQEPHVMRELLKELRQIESRCDAVSGQGMGEELMQQVLAYVRRMAALLPPAERDRCRSVLLKRRRRCLFRMLFSRKRHRLKTEASFCRALVACLQEV